MRIGYCWKVVVDPTRTGDDPGMFYGSYFRWTDIVPPGTDQETRSIPCPWPTGTVFEHIKTGERVVIRKGRVVKQNGKDLQAVWHLAEAGKSKQRVLLEGK